MVEHERTGWVDAITWRFSRIAMILPAVIVIIMIYEVVMRYVFEKPTLWVNEASLWMGGMVYLFAGIYAMQQRGHIRIFILYDMAPLWMRRLFDILSTLGIVLFCAGAVWGAFDEAYTRLMSWERFGTAWDPPIPATMKPLILLTLVVVTIQAVSNLIKDWNRPPEHHLYQEESESEIEEIKRAQGLVDDE